LVNERLVPVVGDRVALEGTLRVRDEFPYLLLNDPQGIQVRPSPPLAVSVAGAAAQPLYQKVAVRGVVRDVRVPYDGLRILTVRDATGEIPVALYADAMSLYGVGPEPAGSRETGQVPDPEVGQSVQVVAGVDRYKGEPQLSVGRLDDLVVLDEALPLALLKHIGELSGHDVGSLVAIEGVIADATAFSAGKKCTIDDGTGTAVLLLWRDLEEDLADRQELMPGARVRVQGEVAEYRGGLEVVPQLPADVVLLAAADQNAGGPLPEGNAEVLYVGEEAECSATHTVRVADATPSPGSTFQAATSTPEPAAGAGPETGDAGELFPTVRAGLEAGDPGGPASTGTAVLKESTAQPTTLVTRLPPATPTVQIWTIGSITGGDVGTVVAVEATIVDLSYFSKGIRATVDDSTGRIILLLWQDVLEEIADRYDLVPGSRLRMTGEVVAYESQLEIIPHQGEQVVFLAAGQRLSIEERSLKDITPSDEGRVFSVEGRVIRTEQGAWLRLWLRDDTGEILVFVPERTVAYLPHGVGAGTRLRVTGEVDIYKGVIEIIPLAGADVEMR
jgi:DNA/RNA endonuclease YhcR with UshA esterase domain